MAQCVALAVATKRIRFATAITPIYRPRAGGFRPGPPRYIHEISAGASRSASASRMGDHVRMGVTPGKPLGDIRAFVERMHSYDGIGAPPPIILAALS